MEVLIKNFYKKIYRWKSSLKLTSVNAKMNLIKPPRVWSKFVKTSFSLLVILFGNLFQSDLSLDVLLKWKRLVYTAISMTLHITLFLGTPVLHVCLFNIPVSSNLLLNPDSDERASDSIHSSLILHAPLSPIVYQPCFA